MRPHVVTGRYGGGGGGWGIFVVVFVDGVGKIVVGIKHFEHVFSRQHFQFNPFFPLFVNRQPHFEQRDAVVGQRPRVQLVHGA